LWKKETHLRRNATTRFSIFVLLVAGKNSSGKRPADYRSLFMTLSSLAAARLGNTRLLDNVEVCLVD